MLHYSEIQNPRAIEENVCFKIRQSAKFAMDKETTGILMTLLLAKSKFEIPEKEKPFLYSLIEKRINGCFDFVVNDNRLLLFLTHVSKTPGSAIMILWYLQWWCFSRDCRELTLNEFCERIFPHGFPSQNDLHSIWDGQKVDISNNRGSDNLVDYASAGKSVFI